jgi:hypothetical protein
MGCAVELVLRIICLRSGADLPGAQDLGFGLPGSWQLRSRRCRAHTAALLPLLLPLTDTPKPVLKTLSPLPLVHWMECQRHLVWVLFREITH